MIDRHSLIGPSLRAPVPSFRTQEGDEPGMVVLCASTYKGTARAAMNSIVVSVMVVEADAYCSWQVTRSGLDSEDTLRGRAQRFLEDRSHRVVHGLQLEA